MERCNCPTCQSFEAARQQSDSARITDALEKIARELEKQNKLNALSFRKDSYVELDEVDEIMEG